MPCYIALYLLMKKNIIPYIALVLLLSSCKSLQQLSSKDNSNTTNTSQAKNTGHVEFLDNIEVTPGAKSATASTPAKAPGEIINNQPDNPRVNTNMADAGLLQLKYAQLLNLLPEQTVNITLLQNIDHWWGTRYCMGGSTENCIDCSAFTQTMMRDVYGVNVPRTAQEQYNISEKVDDADIKEGDLVFFHTGGRTRDITHVGIYLANNKFAHASTSSGVTISDLNDTYWLPRFRGAGRAQ